MPATIWTVLFIHIWTEMRCICHPDGILGSRSFTLRHHAARSFTLRQPRSFTLRQRADNSSSRTDHTLLLSISRLRRPTPSSFNRDENHFVARGRHFPPPHREDYCQPAPDTTLYALSHRAHLPFGNPRGFVSLNDVGMLCELSSETAASQIFRTSGGHNYPLW